MRSSLVLALALAGCGDLLPEANRVPTSLRLDRDTFTVLEGDDVGARVTVLDQNGKAFERIPGWAAPQWALSGSAVVAEGSTLRGVAPGQSLGTVTVANLSAAAVLRVNPRALALITDAYVTQSVQRADGSVPLVAGRDGFLRVFLRGDQPNFFTASVRVQLFRGGVLQQTIPLAPTADSIPVVRREGDLGASYNVRIPASMMQPGLSLVVEADPAGAVPRKAGSRARLPAVGTLALDIRTVPKLWLRLIPVHQSFVGRTGRVSAANKDQFVRDLLAMFPIAEHDIDLRTAYTTTVNANTSQGWSTILNELRVLRTLDSSGRYYYGIMDAGPSPSLLGIGYLGQPAALGFDVLPEAAGTLAHELGHNFDRRHTPCGNPAGPDPAYPYAEAAIGVFGYDLSSGVVKTPTADKDLMSYCRPRWVSDYTYQAVLNFRAAGDNGTRERAADAPAEPSLLVWGRVGGATSVIEPAFELTTAPSLPARPGPYTLQGLDAGGAVLFSLPFDGDALAEHDTNERQFAFAIPARMAHPERLARLRVTGPGVAAERGRADGSGRPGMRPAAPRMLGRRVGGEVRLEWPQGDLPMALVRDARTGEVLSFARGGGARLQTGARELDVVFSDGIRSVRNSVVVQ
jgi:hypothetical protein